MYNRDRDKQDPRQIMTHKQRLSKTESLQGTCKRQDDQRYKQRQTGSRQTKRTESKESLLRTKEPSFAKAPG